MRWYHAERKITLYTLVDPISPPSTTHLVFISQAIGLPLYLAPQTYTRGQMLDGLMVEAPGTAPGSEWFITMSIYRHSETKSRKTNIITIGGKKKGFALKCVRVEEKNFWKSFFSSEIGVNLW